MTDFRRSLKCGYPKCDIPRAKMTVPTSYCREHSAPLRLRIRWALRSFLYDIAFGSKWYVELWCKLSHPSGRCSIDCHGHGTISSVSSAMVSAFRGGPRPRG